MGELDQKKSLKPVLLSFSLKQCARNFSLLQGGLSLEVMVGVPKGDSPYVLSASFGMISHASEHVDPEVVIRAIWNPERAMA